MHRFFLKPETVRSEKILLDAKESHHAKNVLRVKRGEVVEILDGLGGRYRAVIAGFDNGRVALSVDARAPVTENGVDITLAASVIKPDRMEWMLEKCCELGVREWMPVITARSVVKLSRERWQAKVARWRKIASESCKQCGQARIPQVGEPVPFKQLLARIGSYDVCLIPTLGATEELFESLTRHRNAKKALVLFGPEGDFTPKEAAEAVSRGAVSVTLGAGVLRSETAALYTLSALRFFYGSSGATTHPGN